MIHNCQWHILSVMSLKQGRKAVRRILNNSLLKFFGRGLVPGENQKEYPLVLEQSDGVVIQCCDWRFRDAFGQFTKDLKVYRPTILATPGSVHDFAVFGQVATEKIGFCIDLLPKDKKRVIVIAHEGCKWCSHHGSPVEQNLREAETKFARKFPHAELEMYMANVRERKRTAFFRRFDQALTTEK